MPATLSFGSTGQASPVSNVATIAGLSFGAESGRSFVVVALCVRSNVYATSVTIGGTSATLLASQVQTSANPDRRLQFWAAAASGTSGDIVATYSSVSDVVGAATWGVYNADIVPSDTDANTSGGGSVTLSGLTVPVDGVGLAIWSHGQTGSTSWSGATERFDYLPDDRFSGADTSTAGTNSITSDGPTGEQAILGVAFSYVAPSGGTRYRGMIYG